MEVCILMTIIKICGQTYIIVNMKRLRMIWLVLTKKYVSVYTRENDQENCETHYETNAPNALAAHMASCMCMWAKSVKYRKEQPFGVACKNYEPFTKDF